MIISDGVNDDEKAKKRKTKVLVWLMLMLKDGFMELKLQKHLGYE